MAIKRGQFNLDNAKVYSSKTESIEYSYAIVYGDKSRSSVRKRILPLFEDEE